MTMLTTLVRRSRVGLHGLPVLDTSTQRQVSHRSDGSYSICMAGAHLVTVTRGRHYTAHFGSRTQLETNGKRASNPEQDYPTDTALP
jgi:hypothetical protein